MDLPTMAGQADEELNLLLGEISSLRGAADTLMDWRDRDTKKINTLQEKVNNLEEEVNNLEGEVYTLSNPD